ncbi:cell division control protein 14, SIN component-domain-containing protein [Trametes gibbosa]|nr:cell division control protein 14, SIN component-domain-containing protein [Trametes gibbosa]
MHDILQDALDDLASSRTSISNKGDALVAIEQVLAETCDPRAEGLLAYFNALQDTFQCNVSSRIITWVAATSSQLDAFLGKASIDRDKTGDATTLAGQLSRAMAIIQGVALTHQSSKQSLGRRYSLEVLLDLLLVSRHLETASTSGPSAPTSPRSGASFTTPPHTSEIPLTSVVIDTLLCILVDSVPALRVFEELNGVQVIVKILKRAGTPREVRMKCLEFLYFYLLDETANVPDMTDNLSASAFSTPETTPSHAPSAPHRSYPSISATSDASYTTASSSRSSSASSAFSVCSNSTTATSRSLHELAAPRKAETSKTATEPPSHPTASTARKSVIPGLVPSPRTVTPPSGAHALSSIGRGQPRSLLMLRKEVDYIPQSPKKPEISHLGRRPSSLRPQLRERTNVSTRLRGPADMPSAEETESEERAARHAATSTNTSTSTPRSRPSGHSRGLSASAASSLSTTATSPLPGGQDAQTPSSTSTPRAACGDAQTPKLPSLKLHHRRTQSLADVLTESPGASSSPSATRLSGADVKLGPRSASSPTAAAAAVAGGVKRGPRTMEEKKEILGSMLGNVDALVEGVRKAGIWGLS